MKLAIFIAIVLFIAIGLQIFIRTRGIDKMALLNNCLGEDDTETEIINMCLQKLWFGE